MEGYSEDSTSPTKKEREDSPKKKATTFGLGKSTFEFVNKKDKAEKIAEAPLWEKLIPKDGGVGAKSESSADTAESASGERLATDSSPSKNEHTDAESAGETLEHGLENLSDTELAEVRKQVAREESAQLKAERSAEDEPDVAAGREEAIKHLDGIAESTETITTEPIESFTAVTAVGSEALSAAKAETTETVEFHEADAESPTEFAHGQEISFNSPEDATDSADGRNEIPIQSAAEHTVPPAEAEGMEQTNSDAARQVGSGRAGNIPPTPPNTSAGGPTGPNNPNSSYLNFGGNVTPSGNNPNTATGPTRVEFVRDTRSENTYFLAGGILGYMLGRRRGRIKTEKRMKAVSKKLEKQISDVRKEVVQQAVIIREQARVNYNKAHEAQPAPRAVETAMPRTEAPKRQPENAAKITPETKASAEQVRSMEHREVLAVAEKVVINGISLRTIFESKQITEPGLRRITSEYLNGGDLQSALEREVQVKEMQYERDPQMRDRLAASYAGVDAAQPQASHESMVALQAHAQSPSREKPADKQPKAVVEAQEKKDRAQQVLVSAWVVLVIVLVIVAVILGSR